MTVLFLHGSFSAPEDAWWPWLKQELEKLGNKVLAPQFPVDHWSKVGNLKPEEYQPSADLNSWIEKFQEIKAEFLADKDRVVIGHSLGPLFLLHLLEKYQFAISRAVLVAPFLELHGKSAIVEKFNEPFYKTDFEKIRRLMPNSTVIYSDNDPYVDNAKSLDFAKKFNSRIIEVHGLGHMGLESKLTQFPEVLRAISTSGEVPEK